MLDLWFTPAAPTPTIVLGADERSRHARFLCERAREAYARAHSLKRRVLSHYLPGTAPPDWTFVQGPAGKPAPVQPFPHRFNLSHSGLSVAIAVAGCEVGVDVERCRPLAAAPALAERVFHRRERLWLARQPSFEPAFFRLWTMKEALLKAAGTGFSHPADEVGWNDLDEPWPRAWFAGRHWRGFGLRCGDAALAVALAGDSPPPDGVRLLRIDGAATDVLRWTEQTLAAEATEER